MFGWLLCAAVGLVNGSLKDVCPPSHVLEVHTQDHGTVCRSRRTADFVCPRCCWMVNRPPWCVENRTTVCRGEENNCRDTSTLCAAGTTAELHTGTHGDVCRTTTADYTCPKCCFATAGPPHCFAGTLVGDELERSTLPCRLMKNACASNRTTFRTAGATPKTRRVPWTLAVVLRTWKMDVEIGLVALRALVALIPLAAYRPTVIIITDKGSAQEVEAHVNECTQRRCLLDQANQQINPLVVVEPTFLSDGHIQQKYSKLTADTHTDAEYIMHVDSDVRFHTWDEHCFFGGADHKPLLEYAPWAMLPTSVRQWQKGSEVLLGVPVEFEFSRSNQHVYPRELYKKLREYISTREHRSFEDVFVDRMLVGTHKHMVETPGSLLISDFNLLGGYAHYFGEGLMHEVNLGAARTEATAICSSQCNTRMYTTECCIAWFKSINEYQYNTERGSHAFFRNIQSYSCASFLQTVAPTMCPFVERINADRRVVSRKYGIADCGYDRMNVCTFNDKRTGKCPYNTTITIR